MWSRTQGGFWGVSVSFSLCSGLRLNMVHLGRGLSLGSCYPLVSVEAVLVYITCSNHKLTETTRATDGTPMDRRFYQRAANR